MFININSIKGLEGQGVFYMLASAVASHQLALTRLPASVGSTCATQTPYKHGRGRYIPIIPRVES